jgi:hypothetical protein
MGRYVDVVVPMLAIVYPQQEIVQSLWKRSKYMEK